MLCMPTKATHANAMLSRTFLPLSVRRRKPSHCRLPLRLPGQMECSQRAYCHVCKSRDVIAHTSPFPANQIGSSDCLYNDSLEPRETFFTDLSIHLTPPLPEFLHAQCPEDDHDDEEYDHTLFLL